MTTPTRISAGEHQPARRCSCGRAGSGCRPARRTGPAPGPRAGSPSRAPRSPRRPARGPPAAAPSAPTAPSTSTTSASTPSCSTTPAASQMHRVDQLVVACRLSTSQAPYSPTEHAERPERHAHPGHADTSSRDSHLVWSTPGRFGRDQPGRLSRGRGDSGSPCSASATRVRSSSAKFPCSTVCRYGPDGCSEYDVDVPTRRRVDEVEQVTHPDAGPLRARAPPLDAGDREAARCAGSCAAAPRGSARRCGRRAPPRGGTPTRPSRR